MPELPEVEVVRQSLDEKIKQKKIKKVIIRNRNLRLKIPYNFSNFLKNLKIIKIERFSKYIIFNLSNNSYCLLHLGMSGTLHLVPRNKKNLITNLSFYNSPFQPIKHNHVEIIFDNFKIIYNDPRRFGFFEIIDDREKLNKKFKNFGPEALDKKFNKEYIYHYFKNKKKNIKNFLIDQKFVSGIGNIYASEILFECKINPIKKANLLNKDNCDKIVIFSKKVLLDAIRKGGSSIKNFKNIAGTEGNFQKNFNVYFREGLNCKKSKCHGTIKKKIISNRSTFFCNICQK